VVVGGTLGEKFASLKTRAAAPEAAANYSACCGRLNLYLRQQLISSRNHNYIYVHIVNTVNNYLLNTNYSILNTAIN
jgi:hypothetical protein